MLISNMLRGRILKEDQILEFVWYWILMAYMQVSLVSCRSSGGSSCIYTVRYRCKKDARFELRYIMRSTRLPLPVQPPRQQAIHHISSVAWLDPLAYLKVCLLVRYCYVCTDLSEFAYSDRLIRPIWVFRWNSTDCSGRFVTLSLYCIL